MKISIECDGEDFKRVALRFAEDTAEIAKLSYQVSILQGKEKALQDEVHALKNAKMSYDTRDTVRYLVSSVHHGNAISSIKFIRELLGIPLKEAKDLYEAGKADAGYNT